MQKITSKEQHYCRGRSFCTETSKDVTLQSTNSSNQFNFFLLVLGALGSFVVVVVAGVVAFFFEAFASVTFVVLGSFVVVGALVVFASLVGGAFVVFGSLVVGALVVVVAGAFSVDFDLGAASAVATTSAATTATRIIRVVDARMMVRLAVLDW